MPKADAAIDDASTTRPRAGMVWKDRRELPGLALMMVAVLVLVGCVTAIAIGNAVWATGLAVVLVGAAAGGLSWMLIGRRRTGRAGKHRRAR